MTTQEISCEFWRPMLRKQRISDAKAAMAQIINLRRTRKTKRRAAKAAEAETSRAQHGIAKPVRALARARREKTERESDSHRLDKKN
jgi:hypothetical protein